MNTGTECISMQKWRPISACLFGRKVCHHVCKLAKWISALNHTTGICLKYHGEEDSKLIISIFIAQCFLFKRSGGGNGASSHWSTLLRRQIKHRVQHSRKHYNWNFSFCWNCNPTTKNNCLNTNTVKFQITVSDIVSIDMQSQCLAMFSLFFKNSFSTLVK